MPKTFKWRLPIPAAGARRGPRFWLQLIGGALALLNGAALFFYFDPPGGSRKQLAQEGLQVRQQIVATRSKMLRLQSVSAKVQTGNTESTAFETKYFLPKRTAYSAVIAELQRMAGVSGLQQREWVSSEEPIEGAPGLALLNIAANYEGPYQNLMHFLYEADRSPMLLMLDTLTAAPQQKGGQINVQIRFQTIIKEEAPVTLAGQR